MRKKYLILVLVVLLFSTAYAEAGTWTTLDVPGASNTGVYDIDSGNILGTYDDYDGVHGFLYDGTTWTTLDMPGASATWALGIDGSNIVGVYPGTSGFSHGFLYDGTTWTTIDMPGVIETAIRGIEGNDIFGQYRDSFGTHGFIYTIPEPATLLLLGLGGIFLRKRHRIKTPRFE